MVFRFGVFEFDGDRLELSRGGRPVRLQPQPAQVLAALIAKAGAAVTRDELKQAVWRDDTFVDFDRGLNFCIAQIRTALGDDSTAPRYIRTIPKKGYAFIAPIGQPQRDAEHERRGSPRVWRSAWMAALIVAGSVLAVGGAAAYRAMTSRGVPIIAIVRFDNETGDESWSRFADTLTDAVTAQLTAAGAGTFGVVGNAAVLRGPREGRDLRAIASSLSASFIVLGQVQSDGRRVRVLAHLIRMPDQTHVKVSRTEDIGEPGLTVADDIAAKIARAFGSTLGSPPGRDSRVAATR